MVQFYIGDLLSGARIQILPDVISGTWAERLNGADQISCTVPLGDPVIRRMRLMESATVGKAFLAAVDGDTVLAAGPIWDHDFVDDGEQLTLTALGMWSYFDHRVLLPVLAGRLPSDPTTDTNLVSSLQGIARAYVAQAQAWTGGNVPVILPDEIPGDSVRNEAGSALAFVGPRLKQLTEVDGGPDIKFTPRFTASRTGIEWVMQIGTPEQPLITGAIRPTFNVGLPESSVSKLRVTISGDELTSQAFASGGRASDEVLISQSIDATLTNAGYPLLDSVDSGHSSVSEAATLQGYSDEMVVAGRRPRTTISFDHQADKQPYLQGFNVGDFAIIKVRNNAYLQDIDYSARIIGRSGDAVSSTVSLTFAPEVL